MNESLADFFGKMVEDAGDWTIGDTLGLTSAFEGIRDLQDPARLQGQYLASDNSLQTKPYPVKRADEAPIAFSALKTTNPRAIQFL